MSMNFNDAQKQCINFDEGTCMVVASAGSGKTTVIVNRIKRLIDNGKRNIMVITFTRNSANDLKKKLEKLGVLDSIIVGTFHAICGRILSIEGMYKSEQLKQYEIENLFNKVYPTEKVDINDVLSFISYQKNYMKTYEDDFIYKDSKYTEEELRLFFREYENLKESKGIIDMDDMLLKAYDVLKANPTKYRCDYLLVDESQDSNLVQNKLVELLCPTRNIMSVGDVKQSLYSFRGAVPEYFMEFDTVYPNTTVINLDYNYRSRKDIVENANKFIRNYYGDYKHYSDSIAANQDKADIEYAVHIVKEQEALVVVDKVKSYLEEGVEPNEIAILYRNNIDSQFIENELKLLDIDYFIEKNGGFFQRKEINIILCMLRLIVDNEDDGAFETIVLSRVHYFKFFKKTFMSDVRNMSGLMNVSFMAASEMLHGLKPWERKNILSFIDAIHRLTQQYHDEISLARIIDNIINLLSLESYLEEHYQGVELDERLQSVENLKKFIKGNTVDSFLRYVYYDKKEEKKNDLNKIQLMTIHKSKGLEFKKVIMIGIEDGRFPSVKVSDIEDEARLFYVGVTRAKESLFLNQIGLQSVFMSQYLDDYEII